MIPDGGWEPESNNTGGAVFASLLPIPFDAVYTEGGDGTIKQISTLPFQQVSAETIGSVVLPVFGSGPSGDRTMRITLRQPKVFGVMLLDSFTPSLVGYEFFDVDPYVQDVCTAPAYQAATEPFVDIVDNDSNSFAQVNGTGTTFTDV